MTQVMQDGQAHLGPEGLALHRYLAFSDAAVGGVEPINPPAPGHESIAEGGGDESGAVEGTHRLQDADTPGGLVSDSGPHPSEDKVPEQEFDCRLVSRQGIIMLVSSGICTARGKFPARSPETPGIPHLPTQGCSCPIPPSPLRMLCAGLCILGPSLPAAFPTPCPSSWLQTGSSRHSHNPPGISDVSLPPRELGTFQFSHSRCG